MGFKLLFDFDLLSRHHSVVTLEELQAEGWNGHLDAVGHFGRSVWAWIKMTRELNVTDEGATYINFGRFDCSATNLERVAQKLATYKFVGTPVYENIVKDAGIGLPLRVTGRTCNNLYLQVSGHLTKSSRIKSIARSFRAKRLGGAEVPYVAVHVRPYTDLCLPWWHADKYDKGKASKVCLNGHLYLVFIEETVQHVKRLEETVGKGKAKLFVMSYPELRPLITKKYDEVGLKAVFYDMPDLESELGYRPSISMLGMVEQEIAFQANIFIGSSRSTMTGMVQQERFARGVPMEDNTLFTSK
ncbi:hypothetical protein HYH03_012055 [Edaphochlamys debaryana]|uniref:O-fucosyltransferase family protein n=1 Tax=Edaphochlamys debaryana TaxID=47281 RepID=A0A836BUV8_9CHLO|nr:hypothetical protein HYH03_012055 [Edaphochlamys debaryana]|eukprot:KAG2489417.1 hypothetical protein HYH03_012055 [Edaphochlamys debaryana]